VGDYPILSWKTPTQSAISQFVSHVYGYYALHGRSFVWREKIDPYSVFISEMMLQQTQTGRVVGKFQEWIDIFPNFLQLSQASWADVLKVWKGLGYNRRALWIYEAAQRIVLEYHSTLPCDVELLMQFKGIGQNTAASMITFAYDKPIPFIETNIRSVYLATWFREETTLIHDREIWPILIQSLDHRNPREWHYASMDYGCYVKKKMTNPSRKSAHHIRQSTFLGSARQLRGKILEEVLRRGSICKEELLASYAHDNRISRVLHELIAEKLIYLCGEKITLQT